MKKWLKWKYRHYNIKDLKRAPFLWIYAAYLTLRFVDDYSEFPAIRFNSKVKVIFKKGKKSFLSIRKQLIFEPFISEGTTCTRIVLADYSRLIIEREFTLGDGIRILVGNSAVLIFKGKEFESASGITANSVVMVNKHLEIGKDCIIAWDTFITDCDWHGVENKRPQLETIIGDHVWIGVGAKILKGSVIGNNSIVTTNTVVLTGSYPEQSLIIGVPGKVAMKSAPLWQRDM